MRRVRYQVACSLDGYIAGPDGKYDWIVHDPEIDFAELMSQYDTLLIGRKTYEMMRGAGEAGMPGMEAVVFSRTLRPSEHPDVRIVAEGAGEVVAELRSKPGKDIWLFGGGELFRSLLEQDCVDTVEPAVVPVLLGGGVPLLPSPAVRRKLSLTGRHIYEKSGIVLLQYAVERRAEGKRGRAKKATP